MANDIKRTDWLSEWEAWRRMGESLIELGFEGWDDPKLKRLYAETILWGECLSKLRSFQDEDERAKAFVEAAKRASRI